MFKNSNKVLIFILMLSIIISMLTQPLFATGINKTDQITQFDIQPRWINVASADFVLHPKSPYIYASIAISSYTGTTYKDGTVTLTKLTGTDAGWTKKWTDLSSSISEFFFEDTSVTPTRGQYRLEITITTVRNNVEEVFSHYIDRSY